MRVINANNDHIDLRQITCKHCGTVFEFEFNTETTKREEMFEERPGVSPFVGDGDIPDLHEHHSVTTGTREVYEIVCPTCDATCKVGYKIITSSTAYLDQ